MIDRGGEWNRSGVCELSDKRGRSKAGPGVKVGLFLGRGRGGGGGVTLGLYIYNNFFLVTLAT